MLVSNEELIERVGAGTMCGRQPLILMKISLTHPQLRKEFWASTMCDSSSPLVNFPVGGTGWCETWIPFLFCAVDVGVGFRILLSGCCGSWIKIIEELFRNGLRHLVISGVVLRGISCKAVHYEENIIKPPLTLFQCRKWVDTISNGFIVVLFFIGALSAMRSFLCRMQLLLLLFARGPNRVIETACFDAKVQ